MSTMRINYPVDADAKRIIAEFPAIGMAFRLPKTASSEYEIVRLLGGTHYPHIRNILQFIDKWLPISGPIGRRLLKTKHPFEFDQGIAELYLLAHLKERMPSAEAVDSGAAAKCHDMQLQFDDFSVKLEVYTPVDLIGFQVIQRYVPMVLEHLKIERGYCLKVEIRPVNESEEYDPERLFFPYAVPGESDVHDWLNDFARRTADWLASATPHAEFVIPGPGDKVEVDVELEEFLEPASARLIRWNIATRSTDSKLFFQLGTPERTADSEWGRKLGGKLHDQQCGPPSDGVLRILIVNFALADTGTPHFICEPWFAKRFDETIRILVGVSLPFDIVIPAQLGLNCYFGRPVWFAPDWQKRGANFLAEASFDIPGRSAPPTTPEQIAEAFDQMRALTPEGDESP